MTQHEVNSGLVHFLRDENGRDIQFRLKPTSRSCFICSTSFETHSCPEGISISDLKTILDRMGESPDLCPVCFRMQKRLIYFKTSNFK
jgi:hypothetical protein